jgi:hypothetical protein
LETLIGCGRTPSISSSRLRPRSDNRLPETKYTGSCFVQ